MFRARSNMAKFQTDREDEERIDSIYSDEGAVKRPCQNKLSEMVMLTY